MKIRSHCFLLCLLALVSTTSAFAEQPWTEVRSPHFRVLTNGSAADARHVAHEFEQMRYVFATHFSQFRLESGAPLTIFAARDEETANRLLPQIRKSKSFVIDGKFLRGWEKQFAMVRLDSLGPTPYQIVYFEYAQSVFRVNFHLLPSWLNVGLAEFYSYTRFLQDKVEIGAPTIRVRTLQETPLPIETLLDPPASFNRDGYQTEMFYAESWALIHYMTFGEGMAGGTKLSRFVGLLQEREDQRKAFHEVFGDFAPMDKALQQYMRHFAFHASVLPDSPQITEKQFTTRILTLAETHAELAGFHLWSHNLSDARPLVARALQEDPKLGIAHEANGFLLFSGGEDSAAREEFAQAYTLDNTLYLSLFAKTMLSPVTSSGVPADETALHDNLIQVAAINPQFAPAFVQLARLSMRRGDPRAAFGVARRAEELEPSRAGYHLLTGQILLRMGKDAEAAEAAQYVAQHWYSTDRDEAIELWNAIPAAHRSAGVTLTEQIPGEVKTISGTVQAVTCGEKDKPETIVVANEGKPETFQIKGLSVFGFSDTAWWGEDHFSPCHHLEGMRAVIRYRPATAPNLEAISFPSIYATTFPHRSAARTEPSWLKNHSSTVPTAAPSHLTNI